MTSPHHATTYPVAGVERRFTAFAVDRTLVWLLLGAVGVGPWLAAGDGIWAVIGAVAVATVLVWLLLSVLMGAGAPRPGRR